MNNKNKLFFRLINLTGRCAGTKVLIFFRKIIYTNLKQAVNDSIQKKIRLCFISSPTSIYCGEKLISTTYSRRETFQGMLITTLLWYPIIFEHKDKSKIMINKKGQFDQKSLRKSHYRRVLLGLKIPNFFRYCFRFSD